MTDCNFAFNIYISLDPDVILSQKTYDFFDIIFSSKKDDEYKPVVSNVTLSACPGVQ